MTCRTIEPPVDADLRRVDCEGDVEAVSTGVGPDSEGAKSDSVIAGESAIDSIMDDELAIEEDAAAVLSAPGGVIAGEAATAGVAGEVMGIGFGLSNSDAANLSPGPSEATTRNP